jgi:hypothetical protein
MIPIVDFMGMQCIDSFCALHIIFSPPTAALFPMKNGDKMVILAGSSYWKQPAHGYRDFQNPELILQNLPDNSSRLNALAGSRLWIVRITGDPKRGLSHHVKIQHVRARSWTAAAHHS